MTSKYPVESLAISLASFLALPYSQLTEAARAAANAPAVARHLGAEIWDSLTPSQRLARAIDLDREVEIQQVCALFWGLSDLEESIATRIESASTSAERNALALVLSEVKTLREENPAPTRTGRISATDAKNLGERERGTLLKIIIGLAIGAYRYVPSDGRSTIVTEIVRDLDVAGVGVGEDTVRAKLKEAAKYLPSEGPRKA